LTVSFLIQLKLTIKPKVVAAEGDDVVIAHVPVDLVKVHVGRTGAVPRCRVWVLYRTQRERKRERTEVEKRTS
jgi:hypothetical protein